MMQKSHNTTQHGDGGFQQQSTAVDEVWFA
jgi:hypothetical protein